MVFEAGLYDALRYLVLAQLVIVWVLYTHAALRALYGFRRERQAAARTDVIDSTAIKLRGGRINEMMAVMFFMAGDTYSVVDRIGNHVMDMRTPLTQIALIFAVFAWSQLHRRKFVPTPIAPMADATLDDSRENR